MIYAPETVSAVAVVSLFAAAIDMPLRAVSHADNLAADNLTRDDFIGAVDSFSLRIEAA
jgi:hypothetical protein